MTGFRDRDNINKEAVIDKSGAVVDIAFAHEATHRDVIVQATDYATGISTPRNYLLKTPADPASIHLVFGVKCSGAARVEFFEGTTVSSVGTPVPTNRMNRTSVKSVGLLVFVAPTITADGSRIQDLYNGGSGLGGSQNGGDVAAHEDAEWLLKPDTNYLVRVTPTGSSTIGTMFEWYEV